MHKYRKLSPCLEGKIHAQEDCGHKYGFGHSKRDDRRKADRLILDTQKTQGNKETWVVVYIIKYMKAVIFITSIIVAHYKPLVKSKNILCNRLQYLAKRVYYRH